MYDKRKRLEDSARLLRVRLSELEQQRHASPEIDHPVNEVATNAVREELTKVGRELRRMDYT
jgi:hypothetical protein